MNLFLIPIQRVLLEYVLKLGKVVFFSGLTKKEDILSSKLSDDEKTRLKKIIEKNNRVFNEKNAMAYILIESVYSTENLSKDASVVNRIFEEAERALDYVRISECPFQRSEYFIGVPGLERDIRYLIEVDEEFNLGLIIEGMGYYYSMQKGIGLDIGSKEDDNPYLYEVLYSDRDDIVYNIYRKFISDACESLRINDENRCFIFLLSKIDGMGLCDSFHFKDNKKRILSVISNSQREFDVRSNQLFIYSKYIRTEVVHKGRKITEFVTLDNAQRINQILFNTIIEFCCSAIHTNITSLEPFKRYLDNESSKYVYTIPEEQLVQELPIQYCETTTYVATVEGLEVNHPCKRGNYLLLPPICEFGINQYYKNYVAKDLGEAYDDIFEDYSTEEMEYIIEILSRMTYEKNYSVIIGIGVPRLLSEENISSPLLREMAVDRICNDLNVSLYYDLLSHGELINGDVLPPRVGIKDGIRLVYEFIEDEELCLRAIPGRVFGQYIIPRTPYRCVSTFKSEIYSCLFDSKNYIDRIYKNALINICEAEYMFDMTGKVSYLFDIFDSLEPRSMDDKAIQYVFAFLAENTTDYNKRVHEFKQKKRKYRNPILHGGKNIYEIEPINAEIKSLIFYLKDLIVAFCLAVKASSISNWDELDKEYLIHQKRLGI